MSLGLAEAEKRPDLWVDVVRLDEAERLVERPLSGFGVGDENALPHVGVCVEQGPNQ